MPLQKVVARKTFTLEKLKSLLPKEYGKEALEQILIEAKYKNYIQKQMLQIEDMENMLKIKIPDGFDFQKISGLSNEVKEKLKKFSPPTLFAASQISGITPAAIDILHIYIKLNSKN